MAWEECYQDKHNIISSKSEISFEAVVFKEPFLGYL